MLWNTGESMFLHLFLMSFLFLHHLLLLHKNFPPPLDRDLWIHAHLCTYLFSPCLDPRVTRSPPGGCLLPFTVIAFPASDLIQLPAFSTSTNLDCDSQKLSGLSVITTVSSALSLGFCFSFFLDSSPHSPHGTCPCVGSLIGLLEPWLTSPNSELQTSQPIGDGTEFQQSESLCATWCFFAHVDIYFLCFHLKQYFGCLHFFPHYAFVLVLLCLVVPISLQPHGL